MPIKEAIIEGLLTVEKLLRDLHAIVREKAENAKGREIHAVKEAERENRRIVNLKRKEINRLQLLQL